MNPTYTTDNQGIELPATERDPRAAFHFTRQGINNAGATVWRCDAIQGRGLTLRSVFTSYYTDSSISGTWTMGWLLFRQMLQHERVSQWEAELAQRHQVAA